MQATNSPKAEALRFRPDPEEADMLVEMAGSTGLKKPEIARRALKYALKLFLSGEVNILTLKRRDEEKP